MEDAFKIVQMVLNRAKRLIYSLNGVGKFRFSFASGQPVLDPKFLSYPKLKKTKILK